VEGVQDGDSIVEFIADGVGIAAKWVQGGGADVGGERASMGTQPVGVGFPGPTPHQVQQPGSRLAIAPGQVHDPGLLLGSLSGPRLMMPDVFVGQLL